MTEFLQMTPNEYDNMMCEKFPKIFAQRHLPMTETCMCWGFDVGPGWYELIHDLCVKLQTIERSSGLEIQALQVKEKFGTLRFYFHVGLGEGIVLDEPVVKIWSDIVFDLVNNAESKSAYTCETCGEWAKVRDDYGWLRTLCSEHYNEFLEKRQKDNKEEKMPLPTVPPVADSAAKESEEVKAC